MSKEPTTTLAHKEITEAIDATGPVLFGADWIDRLTPEDREFLEQHDTARLFIGGYSPDVADRMARLIGQDTRMGVQRATALRWLYENEVVGGMDLKCDAAALSAAIAGERAKQKPRNQDGALGNKQGRPPKVSEGVVFKMLSALRNGEVDKNTLSGATGEFLKMRYGASINTCFEARKVVLAEWDRQHGEAFSKTSS